MTAGRRPRRVALTLAPSERDALQQLAHRAREPEATTAARLLRAALVDHGAALDAAVRRRTAPQNGIRPTSSDGGAAWLPPARRAVAIEALRDRYPHELRHLRGDALTDPAIAEQLAALTVWREQLDDGTHPDPRMELAFAHELRALSVWLQAAGRRTTRSTPRTAFDER